MGDEVEEDTGPGHEAKGRTEGGGSFQRVRELHPDQGLRQMNLRWEGDRRKTVDGRQIARGGVRESHSHTENGTGRRQSDGQGSGTEGVQQRLARQWGFIPSSFLACLMLPNNIPWISMSIRMIR